MLNDEKLQLIRRLAVQARNTDTGDESVNFAINAIVDGFDTLLDEIARLLDENERLKAARLRPETVNFIRHEMFLQWNHPEDADEEVDAVIADLDRCYPEEV
jgi:hypothetical protein